MPEDALTTAGPTSDLARFLDSLSECGRPIVGASPVEPSDSRTIQVLEQMAFRAGLELRAPPPPLDPAAALWAARLLYQLCQFVALRDVEISRITAACTRPCPSPRSPETDWSADVSLRHLPRLLRIAQRVSLADPLIDQIHSLAALWPLSSVGIARPFDDEHPPHFAIDSFIEHPALRGLYADRIAATQDWSRLGHPRVDDQLRADLGLHSGLSPNLAARLSLPQATQRPQPQTA